MTDSQQLSTKALESSVHAALTAWNEVGGNEENLLGSLLQVRQEREQPADFVGPGNLRQATNRVLLSAIEELAGQDETSAHVLRLRFEEGHITRRVAAQMHASPDQVNRWQRAAIAALTLILYEREAALREARTRSMLLNLPAPGYTRLFGFDNALADVNLQLQKPEFPWIIALTGIGGIGKTSLAHAIAESAVRSLMFTGVTWVHIPVQSFSGGPLHPEACYEMLLESLASQVWPAGGAPPDSAALAGRLRERFQTQPYLVVVDNLETVACLSHMLDLLRPFCNPTKFILTSRARPARAFDAFFFPVDELNQEDAIALLRHEAALAGTPELATAKEEALAAICALTGGNPLALKLVAGLADVLPLSQILTDLRTSRSGVVEDMYKHIYWNAWRSLTADSQALLQAMPLVGDVGALPEQMQAISGLESAAFWNAVTQLASRSLLEVRGTLQERRYGIHRLTETFLRTEIIHWPLE